MTKIPDYFLEKYALGKFTKQEKEKYEATLLKDESLCEKVEFIKEENLLFKLMHEGMIDITISHFRERVKSSKKKRKHGLSHFMSFKMAYTTALLVILCLPVLYRLKMVDKETTRMKGSGGHINIYKKAGKDIHILKSGTSVKEGDKLQISYQSPVDKYGLILSIDGNGIVTLHYPYSLNGDQSLVLKKEQLLKYSYILDDAPRFEQFYFITDAKPLDVDLVIKKAESVDMSRSHLPPPRLDLPENHHQYSLHLSKRTK